MCDCLKKKKAAIESKSVIFLHKDLVNSNAKWMDIPLTDIFGKEDMPSAAWKD